MPSSYAHYRFGTQILPGMPADVRRPVQRFRNLFDVGLHGPDLFFYYNFFKSTPTGALGGKFHNLTGREFFTRCCKRLRLGPSDPGMAYLYGVLGHYCLDSVCHPFICAQTDEGPIMHTEFECEFDRFLLTLDGKPKPHTFDGSPHMKLSKADCAVVAEFYPPATPGQIGQSVRNMAFATKMLASASARGAMEKVLGAVGGQNKGMLMTKEPNPSCAHLDEPLLQLYNKALGLYPEYLEQLVGHMTYNAPFGPAFDATFG